MNFLTMQTEVSDRVRAYDSAVAGDLTKIKRWLNMAQQDITGQMNWPFMGAHEIIQTVADITTGTVSINSGSTSLTFSSAPSVSVTDWFIKFSSGDSWYRISSHTAASTSATLTQAYGESSNLSGGTYTLRKLFYSTNTPLDSILDIKRTVNGYPLSSASPKDADVFLPLYWDSGTIYKYIWSIPESDGDIRISFLYSPSSVENLQVRGIKRLSDLSSDSDTSIIPGRWHPALVDRACGYAFSSLYGPDDGRAKQSFVDADSKVSDMARVYTPDLGRNRVMRPIDGNYVDGPAYALPSQYGQVLW